MTIHSPVVIVKRLVFGKWYKYKLFKNLMIQSIALLLVLFVVGDTVATATTTSEKRNAAATPSYWPKYGGDRFVQVLDGDWMTTRIGSIDHPLPFDSMDNNLDPSTIHTDEYVSIPSSLDHTPPGFLGYRGVSFFRRKFQFNLERGARIVFQSCSFYCRIWIDQIEIGEHRTGYVAFLLDIPPISKKKNNDDSDDNHEIFVLVDNRFNQTTAPLHTGGDFWEYSGIMRSVELHSIPLPGQHWPWRVYAFPKTLSSVQLQLHLFNSHNTTTFVDNILVGFDDGQRRSLSGISNSGIIELGTIEVPNPRVWSTTDPQLHTVQVEMNGAILSERFGLRLWSIEDARILLNGEVIKLVGWNHHTQWPDTGASPTNQQLDNDIQLLKEGGANFVRGAHYPQDPRWLDRLDENGFAMWCETGFPGMSVKMLNDPVWRHYQAEQMNEMLSNAMNHASIAFWAFFNEGPSNSADACGTYQENADIIHSRDPTRFVTYASNHGDDKCFAVADVVSRNGYPGWYDQSHKPADYWNMIANQFQDGGKPFLISETGAAGIYEWANNKTALPWTLKFQTQVVSEDVDVALANANISGISLWHFFDFKVADRWENNSHCDYLPNVNPPTCGYIAANTSKRGDRPGGANHKGSIDFFRRKKPVFDIVAAKYNSTKQKKDALKNRWEARAAEN